MINDWKNDLHQDYRDNPKCIYFDEEAQVFCQSNYKYQHKNNKACVCV